MGEKAIIKVKKVAVRKFRLNTAALFLKREFKNVKRLVSELGRMLAMYLRHAFLFLRCCCFILECKWPNELFPGYKGKFVSDNFPVGLVV